MSILQNVLNIARRIIPSESIQYRHGAKCVNEYGEVVATWGDWISASANVQPGIISSFGGKNITEKDYKEMGLDWSHEFFTIWVSMDDIGTVAKNGIADQVKYQGKVFNVIQCANWQDVSGWRRIYMERVMD